MLRKKWVTIVLGILVLLVILVAVAQTILNNKLDNFLRHTLEEQLGTDYDVDLLSCHFSFIQNKLTVKDLKFSKSDQNNFKWIITANNIKFKGFRAVSFLFGNGFGLDELILERPVIQLNKLESDSTKTKTSENSKNIPDVKITIGAINCINGTIMYNPDGPEEFSSNFDFSLYDIHFKGNLEAVDRLWEKSGIQLSACKYQFPDSTYILRVDSIRLPKSVNEIEIKNLHFKSNLSKAAFPKEFGWRKSRFDVVVPELCVSRPANFSDSLLVISKMELDSIHLEIHKDARYPWIDRVTQLPQSGLSLLSLKFKVDSITFKNSSFTFISVFEDGKQSELDFTDISGSLSGFQNMDTTGTAFTFKAGSTFMNQTSLNMETTYRYGKDDPFECKATLGRNKLSFMSDFLQSAAGIQIEEGIVQKLELNMHGNRFGEYGYVDFYYDDLKLQAVDKKTGEEKWFLNVASDLARSLLFWKKNPDNQNFRRGEFQKERTRYKGFPSQWIEGLFAGIIDSVSKVDPSKIQKKK